MASDPSAPPAPSVPSGPAAPARASISRRTAWFLLGVSLWTGFVWLAFIRNLARDHGRPTGFYVAHGVLIVVDLAIAVAVGVVAVRALRATRGAR